MVPAPGLGLKLLQVRGALFLKYRLEHAALQGCRPRFQQRSAN